MDMYPFFNLMLKIIIIIIIYLKNQALFSKIITLESCKVMLIT